jgi:hypothetical protein
MHARSIVFRLNFRWQFRMSGQAGPSFASMSERQSCP